MYSKLKVKAGGTSWVVKKQKQRCMTMIKIREIRKRKSQGKG